MNQLLYLSSTATCYHCLSRAVRVLGVMLSSRNLDQQRMALSSVLWGPSLLFTFVFHTGCIVIISKATVASKAWPRRHPVTRLQQDWTGSLHVYQLSSFIHTYSQERRHDYKDSAPRRGSGKLHIYALTENFQAVAAGKPPSGPLQSSVHMLPTVHACNQRPVWCCKPRIPERTMCCSGYAMVTASVANLY